MEVSRSTRKSEESQRTRHKEVGGCSEGESCDAGKVNSAKGMIKFIFLNAQSLMNKIDLLQAQVCELEPDIFAITESWTHDEISKAELKIQGYELIGRQDRKDTLKGRGGGVLLYSKLPNIFVNSEYESEQIIHATITSDDMIFKSIVFTVPQTQAKP